MPFKDSCPFLLSGAHSQSPKAALKLAIYMKRSRIISIYSERNHHRNCLHCNRLVPLSLARIMSIAASYDIAKVLLILGSEDGVERKERYCPADLPAELSNLSNELNITSSKSRK